MKINKKIKLFFSPITKVTETTDCVTGKVTREEEPVGGLWQVTMIIICFSIFVWLILLSKIILGW